MKPVIITKESRVDGCKFVQMHNFTTGIEVPVYEIFTTSAFNQLIGHVKFLNSAYGDVLYRGISTLYKNCLPAHLRDKVSGTPRGLIKILKTICNNKFFFNSLKLKETIKPRKREDYILNQFICRQNQYRVEGMLQHYSGSTRFLDVVNNHWVALWMGLHKFISVGKGKLFYEVHRREINVEDLIEQFCQDPEKIKDFNPFVYILLLSFPYSQYKTENGVSESDEFVIVDLRKALPSIYLRPHAQHALVVRRRDPEISQKAEYYDLSSQVVAILKIRVDRVSEWLGNGSLLTKENLFPSPAIDQGYNTLLMHTEIFTYPFEIRKYF